MEPITLPEPEPDGETSVERAIATRESRRSFAPEPITTADASQLLWAAQGITHVRDGVQMRAAPSAGATYPLTAFLEVAPDGHEELAAGLYRYDPGNHALVRVQETAVRSALAEAAYDQAVVRDAPASIVIAASYEQTRRQYPEHGERYVHVEVGHAAENVHLVCVARDLWSCPVGAFADATVADVLGLPADLDPLYLVPFGRPASGSG